MPKARWFVVPGAEDRTDPNAATWTISHWPDQPGWNTDLGHEGYGLTKAQAEELANAANAVWSGGARRGLPAWAQHLYDEAIERYPKSDLRDIVSSESDDGA